MIKIIAVEILNGPVSTQTPLGTNATFTCTTEFGNVAFVSWVVEFYNSTYVFDTLSTDDSAMLEQSGIFSTTNGTNTMVLIILGSLSNNNTIVVCKEFSFTGTSFSDPASLMVIGTYV